MSSRDRGHIGPAELVRFVEDPEAARADAHLKGCPACREQVAAVTGGFRELAEVVAASPGAGRASGARPSPSSAGAPAAPAPALSDRGLSGLSRLRLMARAEALGKTILEEGDVVPYLDDPALAQALVCACQGGAKLAADSPGEAVDLARDIALVAEDLAEDPSIVTLIQAEAKLLESQGRLVQGDVAGAVAAAGEARRSLESGALAPELTVGRAKYFEASAVAAAGRTGEAIALHREALAVFTGLHQDHWAARAEAAIGLALLYRQSSEEALEHFDRALLRLDPARDGHAVSSILLNRGVVLLGLRRMAQAKAGFAQALKVSVAAGAMGVAAAVRVNLLGIAVDEGRFDEVLVKGEKILEAAEREYLAQDAFICRLLLAEANAAKGHFGVVERLLTELKQGRPEGVDAPPEFDEILARLEPRDHDLLDRIRRLRAYLSPWEQREEGTA